jgi:hypothetical protein
VCAVNLAIDTFVEVKSVADFVLETDQPTPRGIEAPNRSLKIQNLNGVGHKNLKDPILWSY